MPAVTFRDETATGTELAAFQVADLPAVMTARELIRLRVREEVARFNARPADRFNGLVRPDDAEVELNGYRLREARRLDWERQAAVAEKAFLSNGFFMLAGDRQVEDLDEEIDLTGDPELVFIKLVPLAGG
ncbi:hypothetical protein [Spirillospora sp. NPDC029432]|uniref:hypothetical protein n=1 Tax=Spirillospora sp. NPDC029432 TaxID=3154599 RepID=UPI00345171FE